MVSAASDRVVRPDDVTWTVGSRAYGIKTLKDKLGPQVYEENKQAIKEFLCGYFSSGDCRYEQGNSISPMGATQKGGKILKVRWGLPGRGKSGGLRLVVVAYCEEQKVVLAEAFPRKESPTDTDFEGAVAGLP